MSSSETDANLLLNLRSTKARLRLPEGSCVYVQSGDPGDFDGYFIAAAGAAIAARTENFHFVLVIPERRACPDRTETDLNKHVQEFSEKVLSTAARIFRGLCPTSTIIRGPLNSRNIIPLKFIFSETEKYGPLLEKLPKGLRINWLSVVDLGKIISDPSVKSVMLDMNGSMGYLELLLRICPLLGAKMKASGLPVTIMAGVMAELETTTLRVPDRDPRSTMNAIYSSPEALLKLTKSNEIPLLFVTNNVCNLLLKFQDADDVIKSFQLKGFLKELATVWYGPHLKGKCVPFDWVSYMAMILYERYPQYLKTEKRQLWVGEKDASVLVLLDPSLPRTSITEQNLEGTVQWGVVESVVDIDRELMLSLARFVANNAVI